MQQLSPNDVESIAARTASCLEESYRHLWVDRETHYHDHQWLAEEKKRRLEESQFRKKVIESVTIWAAILVVGFVAVAMWRSVVDAAKTQMGV